MNNSKIQSKTHMVIKVEKGNKIERYKITKDKEGKTKKELLETITKVVV